MLTWLASLRVRLIVTYFMVTVISFGFLVLLLVEPVGSFLRRREVSNLEALGYTLGSTIRTPWLDSTTEGEYLADQRLTQRRCRFDLAPRIGIRARMLDTTGDVMVDSAYAGEWEQWLIVRRKVPSLRTRTEVQLARRGTVNDMDGVEAQPPFLADGAIPGLPPADAVDERVYVAVPIKRWDVAVGEERLAFIMYLDKSASAVRGNLDELRRKLVLGMVISLLVTILVSIIFSSNLSAGLNAAADVARGFASGRMDLRMRGTGRDEVGMLARAFNNMAEALQRQEELRRNLLADVSHELRTPLTAISGCADTLSDGMLREDPDGAERFLGIIQRESMRLQRLVKDILELSKLQAGAVTIRLDPLDIIPVVEDAAEVGAMHALQDGVAVEYVPPVGLDGPLWVNGNSDRLAQSVRNLLDNARHHTPAGKRVRLSLTADRSWVAIRVQDEGVGIPADEIPMVFDRFYRAGKGARPGGTGLGLAIVREILNAHGGRVTVESVLGQGATFTLHLPRCSPPPHIAT